MVHDFRKSGYLPEVLNNFLALLGWSPGGDRERMSMDELVQLFTLEGVGKANAKFNREKLLSFNTDACAAAPIERLVKAFRDYLTVNPDSPLNAATDEQFARLIQMKKGFRVLREVDELSRFLFVADDQIVYDADAVERVLKKQEGQGLSALRDLRPILAGVVEWTAHSLDDTVKKYAEQKQLGLGKVAQPLRVAVTGNTVSPPIFESLEMLGRPRALARIDRCIAEART
jgi:glutamyl-tRNA synthetase